MRIVLLLFMILILVLIILSDSNLRSIILLSVFSILAALVFYLYQAPDVAMAELALGAAVVPLIFLTSTTRQKKYVVEDNTSDGFMSPGQPGRDILERFARQHDLDLVVMNDREVEKSFLFTLTDIDLVVDDDHGTKPHHAFVCEIGTSSARYLFRGSRSSVLFEKLTEMILEGLECPQARIVWLEEGDQHEGE